MWPLASGRDVRMNEGGSWGGIPPPNEASGLWKQHPPIVTRLELDLGGDGTGTGCGQAGRRGGGFFLFFGGGGLLPDRQLVQ